MVRLDKLVVLFFLGVFVCLLMWSQEPTTSNEWLLPELPDAIHAQLYHKDFLRFWRIKDGGDWHLYNKEDAKFLKQWHGSVQWTALEGKLPK